MTAIFALVLTGCAHRQVQPPEIYLLMGQSNMSGRGDPDALSPLERAPDHAILMLDNEGRWRVATEPLDDPAGEVGVAIDRSPGIGPAMFFARAMRRRSDAPVGLVPCAKGGTEIALWAPDRALFANCLARLRLAQTHGRIAGILWYQGESDSQHADRAAAWRQRFETTATRLRTAIDRPHLPVALVILADQPETGNYPYWRTIQTAQRSVTLPCVVAVPATGVGRNPDRLHLSTAGQRILGDRIADALSSQAEDQRCR